MSRVKFNVNSEYAYVQNFKVLQSQSRPHHFFRCGLYTNAGLLHCLDTFTKHHVDKPIPVEALTKCKMQDNLEFLQWTKRFWDQYYPGGDYDAVARRKGSTLPPTGPGAARAAAGSAGAARRGGTTPTTGPRLGAKVGGGGAASAALLQENATLKETVVGLERERDFYFSKLRDIELLIQQAVEADPELEIQEDGLIKSIQAILYSTEEGFEIPEGEALDDQETF
jgi:RP/EB family microtubule-associated protein